VVGETSIRYLNPDRQDDTWLYLPSLRRVRRCRARSVRTRCSAKTPTPTATAATPVRSRGSNGNISGKKKSSPHSFGGVPVKYCEGNGFAFCDTWEKRMVYVLEGVPKIPQYAYWQAPDSSSIKKRI